MLASAFNPPTRTTGMPHPSLPRATGMLSSTHQRSAAKAKPFELVPEQKSVRKPPPEAQEQAWRFRHSTAQRQFWLRILPKVSAKPNEVERFKACGTDAWVEHSPSTGKVRIRSTRCMLRICPACQRAYARRLADRTEQLFRHTGRTMPLFVTLTLQTSTRPLPDSVAFLRSCFRRLRATKEWKQRIDFGIGAIEVTRGKHRDHWHVHIHIIAWGRFYPHDLLERQWRRITYGSFKVDVQRCAKPSSVRHYISDYITKPPAEAAFDDDGLADEWYKAVMRQHWVIRFGKRKLMPKAEDPPKVRDWETVCRLTELIPYIGDDGWRAAVEAMKYRQHANEHEELISRVIDST